MHVRSCCATNNEIDAEAGCRSQRANAGVVHPPEHGLVVVANPGGDVLRQGVLSALSRAAVFHFVGHDRRRPRRSAWIPRGTTNWCSNTAQALGVEDLLLRPAGTMPRVVVLSA